MKDFNWENLRFFLAAVRCDTPAAAASLLRVDHNTVRRRLLVLEQDFEAKLFDKREGKYTLTAEGEILLKAAEKIEYLTIEARSQIAGRDLEISGTVRIAAPDGIATFFLAPRLAGLRKLYPDLNIELIVPHQQSKLSRREADMALTIDRPSDKKVSSEKVAEVMLRLYASETYLANAPKIEKSEDLACHELVTGLGEFDFGPVLNNVLGGHNSKYEAKVACSSIVLQLKATTAGCGVCCFADFIAQTESSLVQILPEELSFRREIWLVIYRDLAGLAKVNAVRNYLVQQFDEYRSNFS